MPSSKVLSATAFLSLGVLSLALTGCTLATTAAPDALAGSAIAGKVQGGQQAINGAKIYLLAVNPAGYGSASLSLLTTALTGNAVDSIGAYTTTTGTGQFSVTHDYSCTTGYTQGATTASGGTTLPGNEQVYLYVAGGDPGYGTGTNASIGLLAALGPCNSQFSSTLVINEITTVAAAYALAGFATDATHIASSGSPLALTGLTNAGATSQNLANVASGTPGTATGNKVVPTQYIATIANMLAACINGAAGSTSCNTLFAYTRTAGASGAATTNTATAAINLAHNPYPTAAGVTALYGLTSGTPPFAGGLTTQPNDFTLGLYFTNSSCFNNGARGLAIDAAGSAWSLGGHGLCKFFSNGLTGTLPGAYGYTGGGYNGGYAIAIDTSGNAWVPNYNANTLSEFSNSGTPMSGTTGFSGGGLSGPSSIAVDGAGNVWAGNQNPGTLSKFAVSNGAALSPAAAYSDGGGNDAFYGIAIDVYNNVWATNYNASSLSEFANSGMAISPVNGFYGNGGTNGNGGLSNAYGIAIDFAGNVWAADYYTSAISKYSSGGSPLSGRGGYVGGGLSNPQALATDSVGTVWVTSTNSNTVSAFNNAGTAITSNPAYTGSGTIYSPVSIALDGSGNVWVTNSTGSITELVGASAPVVTPLPANLVSPYGSATVNRP